MVPLAMHSDRHPHFKTTGQINRAMLFYELMYTVM